MSQQTEFVSPLMVCESEYIADYEEAVRYLASFED